MKRLVYSGSVKDIYQTESPEQLEFVFSDRYSIFDWGEMPDHLRNKGASLAQMGILLFEYFSNDDSWKKIECPKDVDQNWFDELKASRAYHMLCAGGLKHHFVSIGETEASFMVQKIDVFRPTWSGKNYNYWKYAARPINALVPLEVIFRFGVPEGSSLLKRVDNKEYLKALGLEKAPKAKEWLSHPIIEFSTKLEEEDRYIDPTQAQEIAGLSDREFEDLENTALLVACALKNLFDEISIELWDGKFEFAFDRGHQYPNRSFMLVDSIGIDELRLLKNGLHLSKEFLRRQYRDSEWLKAAEEAKKEASQKQNLEWKLYCEEKPKKLDAELRQLVERMYMSVANLLARRLRRKDVFNLPVSAEEVFNKMKDFS